MTSDKPILRDLAEQYAEFAALPRMDGLRGLWRAYCAGERTRPPVLLEIGLWNAWAKKLFSLERLACRSEHGRAAERWLRFRILHASLGDDTIFEPWFTAKAIHAPLAENAWGVGLCREEIAASNPGRADAEAIGTAYRLRAALEDADELSRLVAPTFVIDEAATQAQREFLEDAFAGSLTVHIDRGPFLLGFDADISATLARLRGPAQLMLDMYDRPESLHRLAAFLRDGILAHHDACEAAGDISYASGFNQGMPYHRDLPDPRPNAYGASRGELWAFFAAQEFTEVSPAMHDEFLLAYQKPIMEKWAAVSYGCCENLTRKIDLLRSVPNLRRIGVTPFADLEACARQIGGDYLLSWRPGPSDMVCSRFDESAIHDEVAGGIAICREHGCRFDIMLKDVEALAAGPESLRRWVEIVREVSEENA